MDRRRFLALASSAAAATAMAGLPSDAGDTESREKGASRDEIASLQQQIVKQARDSLDKDRILSVDVLIRDEDQPQVSRITRAAAEQLLKERGREATAYNQGWRRVDDTHERFIYRLFTRPNPRAGEEDPDVWLPLRPKKDE